MFSFQNIQGNLYFLYMKVLCKLIDQDVLTTFDTYSSLQALFASLKS
jgi:hypothetical protein